jgi:hypothetical protein
MLFWLFASAYVKGGYAGEVRSTQWRRLTVGESTVGRWIAHPRLHKQGTRLPKRWHSQSMEL